MEAFGLIQDARGKFEQHIDLLRSLYQRTPVDVFIHNFTDIVPEEVLLVTVILKITQREISHTVVHHAKTHHVFICSDTYLDI
uniref:Uncharacterized protein n=1 Tax=Oryza brachyantha TaxID=4533 RepID=J3KWK4_ORYBR